MTTRLGLAIFVTTAVAALALAAAVLFIPFAPDIKGWLGVAFWTAMTLIASALPVQLPAGTMVSVSFATVIAAAALGGPAAAGIVGGLGTTEAREVRGRIPWYGTLVNHAEIVLPAVIAGVVFEIASGRWTSSAEPTGSVRSFLALVAAGFAYYLVNTSAAVWITSLRSQVRFLSVWSQDIRAISPSLVALIPLAWLMAQIFQLPNGVGWWATPLFVVPLFTTRLAYTRYVETRDMFEQTIGALANAVDARDRYTRGHSNRVSHISEAMSRVMRLPEDEVERIKWAGLLHDIGKIGIRDNILLKEGPLTREERVLMNQHPTIGAEIVAPATQLKSEAPLIKSHHEWINGSGYPEGLEALDIPRGARILTIADAYEAMTSSRPYRKTPLTHEQAVDQLQKFAGIQFDADIVPILVNLDRETLDRPGTTDDALPTMLHQDDLRDMSPAPRVLASDDVP